MGNETDLGVTARGEYEAGAFSARAGEGTAARTDPVGHLPEKYIGLRFIFFCWLHFPWMGECSTDTYVEEAVPEPIVKPLRLKMDVSRMLFQPRLLS